MKNNRTFPGIRTTPLKSASADLKRAWFLINKINLQFSSIYQQAFQYYYYYFFFFTSLLKIAFESRRFRRCFVVICLNRQSFNLTETLKNAFFYFLHKRSNHFNCTFSVLHTLTISDGVTANEEHNMYVPASNESNGGTELRTWWCSRKCCALLLFLLVHQWTPECKSVISEFCFLCFFFFFLVNQMFHFVPVPNITSHTICSLLNCCITLGHPDCPGHE